LAAAPRFLCNYKTYAKSFTLIVTELAPSFFSTPPFLASFWITSSRLPRAILSPKHLFFSDCYFHTMRYRFANVLRRGRASANDSTKIAKDFAASSLSVMVSVWSGRFSLVFRPSALRLVYYMNFSFPFYMFYPFIAGIYPASSQTRAQHLRAHHSRGESPLFLLSSNFFLLVDAPVPSSRSQSSLLFFCV